MSVEQGGGCPFTEQPRTPTQRVQVIGAELIYRAIDLEAPAHGPKDAPPPRVELVSSQRNLMKDRDFEPLDEPSSYLQDLRRAMEHERALRQMFVAPFGFYIQESAYGTINECLEELASRDPVILLTQSAPTDAPPYVPQLHPSHYGADTMPPNYESSYSGNTVSMQREYHGQFAHLLRLAESEVWATATQAYGLMPVGKRTQLERKYAEQTEGMKAATLEYVEKKFPERVGELALLSWASPPLESLEEFSILAKRLTVTENLLDSFTAASLSTVESVVRRLSDLQTVCATAEVSLEEWWPLAYANIRKLAIGSQTSVKFSDIYDFDDSRYENPYAIAYTRNGTPRLDFSDTPTGRYFGKIYRTHRYQACQGAVEELPMKTTIRAGMRKVHARLAERAGAYGMDVNFAGAFSAAQALTAQIVLAGELSCSRLNRSGSQPAIQTE